MDFSLQGDPNPAGTLAIFANLANAALPVGLLVVGDLLVALPLRVQVRDAAGPLKRLAPA